MEKFIGDAVMAVFGAPVAHGDDAERAVRAGLRVLEGIEELNREHDLDLAARAAVNTGDALVSLDTQDGGALATGDVVNTASRLQSAAPTGRLIVGAETYRATLSNYGAFSLTQRGLAVGTREVGVCGPLVAVVPYRLLGPYLSALGSALVGGVRQPQATCPPE